MKSVSLREVCDVFADGDWIESKDQSDGGIRLIQTGNVGVGVFKDRIEKARWISEDTFKRLRCTEIHEGDVLISRLPDPVGRSCLIPALEHKAITAVDCSILRFDPDKMSAKFFIYYSQSSQYANAIEPLISGSTRQRISREKLGTIQIPLPSLKEQEVVVEKLDSAFDELNLLEDNLKLSDERVDLLLQSILGSVFSSIAEEDDSRTTSRDQTTDRKLVALGDVCTVINGGTPDTKNSNFWNGKHAWITPAEMGNLKSPFLGGSKRTLTDEGLGNSSAQLVPKHSVIMSSRAPIGHLVINEIPMASNQGCKGLIPNKHLNYKYLYYFLYANKQYLNELGSGTTFAEISGSKLKTVLIPLPSLEKQSEVVEKLDSVLADIELLKSKIRLEKDFAFALRQSLLSNALTLEEVVA